jgi:hypothetical protein
VALRGIFSSRSRQGAHSGGRVVFIILLSPVQTLVSESTVVFLQYIKVLSIAVALVAGVLLVARGNVANSTTSG